MNTLPNLKTFKKEINSLNSLIIIFRDAVENPTGTFNTHNVFDTLNILLLKIEIIINIYDSISEKIIETEQCMLTKLLLQDIQSLFTILKYAIKAKNSNVTYTDIFNCVNLIAKLSDKVFKYSSNIVNTDNDSNVIYTVWE